MLRMERGGSPLGMLAPGYNEIGDYFKKMAQELEAKPEEYGCENALSLLLLGLQIRIPSLTSSQSSACRHGSTSATARPRTRS
jgi:hypothetical protein